MSNAKGSSKARDYGPKQVLWHTGLDEWQIREGQRAGLIPATPAGGRWPAAMADDLAARREEIVAAVGTCPPIGGYAAADRLSQRTGLALRKADVEALVRAGGLVAVDTYKGWPVYDCMVLDRLQADQLAPIVAEREQWEQASVPIDEAHEYLGLTRREFSKVRAGRRFRRGPGWRYAKADLDELRADAEEVRRQRTPAPQD